VVGFAELARITFVDTASIAPALGERFKYIAVDSHLIKAVMRTVAALENCQLTV
jgi:hypothetical protein